MNNKYTDTETYDKVKCEELRSLARKSMPQSLDDDTDAPAKSEHKTCFAPHFLGPECFLSAPLTTVTLLWNDNYFSRFMHNI